VSTPREPAPGKVVLSVLAAAPWWDSAWPNLRAELVEHFGPVDYETEPLPFDHTDYYGPELGRPLLRRLLGFERLQPLDGLRGMKLWTNTLEVRQSRADDRRRVNLDPGLMTLERLLLASGKNFTHRVYLGSGIWADLTLIYNKRQGWIVLPWTFPDYAAPAMLERLTALRALYKTAVEAGENRPPQGDIQCP
jgi:hypothetical protein